MLNQRTSPSRRDDAVLDGVEPVAGGVVRMRDCLGDLLSVLRVNKLYPRRQTDLFTGLKSANGPNLPGPFDDIRHVIVVEYAQSSHAHRLPKAFPPDLKGFLGAFAVGDVRMDAHDADDPAGRVAQW